jgi:hypothetical protein
MTDAHREPAALRYGDSSKDPDFRRLVIGTDVPGDGAVIIVDVDPRADHGRSLTVPALHGGPGHANLRETTARPWGAGRRPLPHRPAAPESFAVQKATSIPRLAPNATTATPDRPGRHSEPNATRSRRFRTALRR